MISAWNVIGLFVWILIIGWLISMIIFTRKRNQQALLQPNKELGLKNRWIMVSQWLVLIGSILAMTIISFSGNKHLSNVSLARNYKPIVLDTDGHKSYYVNVYNAKRPSQKYYTYLTKGEHYKVSSRNAMIINGYESSFSLPTMTYRSDPKLMKRLDQRYQKAWIETITTKYKPNFWNGLGMRVGRQASRYSIIRVPDQSFIFYH
ncbi:LVIS_2131 family protein [Nicoliella lavandulae]|uniref:LVIS_2131 family protein n=1 Tax=Nicoliella lavandulae TaxID=3082954 RepID=A0ABU8SIW8_9LACO